MNCQKEINDRINLIREELNNCVQLLAVFNDQIENEKKKNTELKKKIKELKTK